MRLGKQVEHNALAQPAPEQPVHPLIPIELSTSPTKKPLKEPLYALGHARRAHWNSPPTGCGNLPSAGMLDLMAVAPASPRPTRPSHLLLPTLPPPVASERSFPNRLGPSDRESLEYGRLLGEEVGAVRLAVTDRSSAPIASVPFCCQLGMILHLIGAMS